MRALKILAAIASGILFLFSLSQFVAPPLVEYWKAQNIGFWEFLGRLTDPFGNQIYQGTPFGGVLFIIYSLILALLIAAACITALVQLILYLRTAYVAISVLRTHLTLTFADESMVRSTIKRTQYIHANRKGVTAYRSQVTVAGAKATIVKDSYTAELKTRSDGPLPFKQRDFGSAKSREFIEELEAPLNVNPLVTWLPNDAVLELKAWFPKTIVERITSLSQDHEYDVDEPVLKLISVRYPITDVKIDIHFPEATAPSEIEAFVVTGNLAKPIRSETPDEVRAGCKGFRVCRNQLKRDATVVVTWKNTQLAAWRDEQTRRELRGF